MWQKKSKLKHLPLLIIICCGWGFTAHKDLHAVACAGMPDEVWAFFKKHQNSLIELSVSADRRKHTDSTEAVKHYLDLDSTFYGVSESGELSEAIRLNFNLLSYLFSRIDSVDHMSIIRVVADFGHYI